MHTKNNILLTGQPGIGKTTLIKKLAEELKDMHPFGFYTSEIREAGIRKGFELNSFEGQRSLLAHVDILSPCRVSKYGVNLENFEKFLDSLTKCTDRAQSVVIIDEIGKMECFSDTFRSLVHDSLNAASLLVATVAQKGSGLIADIKKRDDIELFEVKLGNRDALAAELIKKIKTGPGLNT